MFNDNLNDNKCNNKCIGDVLKSKMFHDYNGGLYVRYTQIPDMETLSIIDKAHSKCFKWLTSPKVKETNFKILHKVYPVAELLRKRFKFDVDPCTFCNVTDETLEHMFSHTVSKRFWLDIKNVILLKVNYILTFDISHISFYMDNQTHLFLT